LNLDCFVFFDTAKIWRKKSLVKKILSFLLSLSRQALYLATNRRNPLEICRNLPFFLQINCLRKINKKQAGKKLRTSSLPSIFVCQINLLPQNHIDKRNHIRNVDVAIVVDVTRLAEYYIHLRISWNDCFQRVIFN